MQYLHCGTVAPPKSHTSVSIWGRGSDRYGQDGPQVAQGHGQPLLGTCDLKEKNGVELVVDS